MGEYISFKRTKIVNSEEQKSFFFHFCFRNKRSQNLGFKTVPDRDIPENLLLICLF